MKLGTKTLLFGTHQFVIHPALMIVAFLKIHKRRPSMSEFLAIVVHDWGYWGCDGIDTGGGENHPYAGARIMERLYGAHGRHLVLGHSTNTCNKNGVGKSSLYLPDKYYFVLLPVFMHWLLARLSGECAEYEKTKAMGIGFNPTAFREKLKQKVLAEIEVNKYREKACREGKAI